MSKNLYTFEVDMQFKVLSKVKAKEIKSLSSKKERDRKRLFLVEGEKGVRDILNSFKIKNLICTKEWLEEHEELKSKFEEEILVGDKGIIKTVSSLNTPSDVIAVCEKPEIDDILPVLSKDKFYLLLDEIQDPGNLGTIIRTCDWFGIYDIFASKNSADAFGPKVVQSTMGSLSRVKVHYLDLEELIKKNRDIKLIGTLLNGIPLKECETLGGGMILMGNEGRGISEVLKKYINIPLTIPPVNPDSHPDSLNVAIATAIILSQLTEIKPGFK